MQVTKHGKIRTIVLFQTLIDAKYMLAFSISDWPNMDKSPNYQMLERDNTPGPEPEMWNHFIFSIALSFECSLAVQQHQQMQQKAVWFLEVSHKYETQ